MLRFVLCGRRLTGLEGVLRVTCRGAVGGRLCAARGGERSLVYTYQVLPDLRPSRIFSTSSSSSLPDEDRLVYTGNLTKAVLGTFYSLLKDIRLLVIGREPKVLEELVNIHTVGTADGTLSAGSLNQLSEAAVSI